VLIIAANVPAEFAIPVWQIIQLENGIMFGDKSLAYRYLKEYWLSSLKQRQDAQNLPWRNPAYWGAISWLKKKKEKWKW